ncbi:MAG: Crp/Fnr family transcriptional regulator [Anaerolineales bacterium]|nr:Crp/Fnr family transcriptional regulator [Anaerolineales bacterium]
MRLCKATQGDKLGVLSKNIYFDNLDEIILCQVTEIMSLYEFERGEPLFWEGDACAGLHILQKGCLKLYRLSAQGRQYIVRLLLQEGETCNEVPVFDGGNNPVNAEALEDSRVWIIQPDYLRELARTYPEYTYTLLKHFSASLRSMVRKVSEMAFYQVTHRLARQIAELSEEGVSGKMGIRLTQEQMAARLGTVREVVARSLKELERSGALRVTRNRIEITDPDLLAEWTHGLDK